MERTFVPELAVGFFQIDLSANAGAVVNMATAWTAAIAADARLPLMTSAQFILLIDAEGGNVRWRNDIDNTTVPTAAIGGRIIQDSQLMYTANSLATLQFIRETAVAAKLNIHIFKHRL